MFILSANKVCLNIEAREPVTSGSVNVYEVQFKFSADWDGLDRTAVFAAGEEQVSVVLGSSNTCVIPWEALQSPRRELRAGVYGTKGGEVVLPTVWASLGTIREGCSPGEEAQPPTPDVYGQILAAAEEAERIAQSVRDDADAGAFDGKQGPKGPQGAPGENGGYYLPALDAEGNLTFSASKPDMPQAQGGNVKGPKGDTGEPGAQGEPGADGVAGSAATIQIGTVTSGSAPSVTNSGTENAAVFDFVLVPGPQGPAGNGLPDVTVADNGKFARVVDGAWAAAAVPDAEEADF